MKIIDGDSSLGRGPEENKKRRREWLLILGLGSLFLVLTWIAFRFFGFSRDLPLEHSIFFFGLVNFNIILFLFLAFLIFRNIVKSFSERTQTWVGTSLKSKLIAAFVAFSFVPTTLMFLVSVFYINSSFDKWFSEKTVGVLKSSMEVMNQYSLNAKRRNYHFAEEIAQKIELKKIKNINSHLERFAEDFDLDAVEFYPSLIDDPVVFRAESSPLKNLPPVSLEFRKKGLVQKIEASYTQHFEEGNLVRVIRPIKMGEEEGALVISTFIPLSLISKLNDISQTYEELKDSNSLAYPLKSIYLIILVLMTLVILLGATWFGFYLARQLAVPMEVLGQAANKVAQGEYYQVKMKSGSSEINQLVDNFNQMSSDLEDSRSELQHSNKSLKKTLDQLDEHSRYMEVVLANVTTGVISVSKDGNLTMVNPYAAKLLRIDPNKYLGKKVKEILTLSHFEVFRELMKTMKKHNATSIQKEIRIDVQGKSIPMQMSLSIMKDEAGNELGKILVFDDLSVVVRAQRAAAWTEVARRIAHEIKNPLTPISLSAQRLQRKFGAQIKDPAFSDCIHMIIDQVDDLKNLVNEFSNFARLPKSVPVLSSMQKVIEDSVLLFSQAHKEVSFNLNFDNQLPDFLFDPDQIKRVFTNLFDNSLSAMENTQAPKIQIDVKYDASLSLVRVSIEDSGPGVRDEIRDRLFEPYVTTKSQGTGLGLAIVKRTVEDHNGFIRAFNASAGGAKIVIELPVVVSNTTDTVVPLDNSMNDKV